MVSEHLYSSVFYAALYISIYNSSYNSILQFRNVCNGRESVTNMGPKTWELIPPAIRNINSLRIQERNSDMKVY